MRVLLGRPVSTHSLHVRDGMIHEFLDQACANAGHDVFIDE